MVIYYEELAHTVMETENSLDLPLASRRTQVTQWCNLV